MRQIRTMLWIPLVLGGMVHLLNGEKAAAANRDVPRLADPLPVLEQFFGPLAGPRWRVEEKEADLRLVPDDILQREVLAAGSQTTLVGPPVAQRDMEISCRVRLATTEQTPDSFLQLAVAGTTDDPSDEEFRVEVRGSYGGNIEGFNYQPYPTISPALEPTIREPLERDLGQVKMSQDRWLVVRLQIGPNRVRGWLDDRLKWEREGESLPRDARVRIRLGPQARLADFTTRSLRPVGPLFEPIPLDGYVQARDLQGQRNAAVADDALPFGEITSIAGIPFRFADRRGPAGADHIDIGPSLFRQANWPGYHPSYGPRFKGTSLVDPARIQLSIPNGRYDALYVIAAFDGEKDSVPILSASFYRPSSGFPMVFETEVPLLNALQAPAEPLPVQLENGQEVKLWRVQIPLDPALLASFSDMETLEVELTKKVYQYRSYPDPYIYGWHQGGLPSGVRVYALTLHRPAVHLTLEPEIFGHVWTAEQTPRYHVSLHNRSPERREVTLTSTTASYDGSEKGTPPSQRITLNPGQERKLDLSFPVQRFGIHSLSVTLQDGDRKWTEQRNFCRLAPDTRAEKWEEGKGPLFGYWSYHGGHYTAPRDHHVRLMTMAGARASIASFSPQDETLGDLVRKYALRGGPNAWPIKPQWEWAGKEPLDREKYAAYQKEAIQAIRQAQGDSPELITFFPEPHLSLRLTCGQPPDYWGEPEWELTEEEKRNLRVFFNTSKAAAEAVRREWPQARILIPWGDPLFVVPLLRAGFPKELIDGSGLDMIGFERLPEMQLHQQTTHRLYILLNEFRKFGLEKPTLPYVEGIFVPTEPGAVTWQEQAERYHRWTLLSLAYGLERFYSGWFAFDCGDYYGAEHYGGCGIQRRIPWNDPKPAYAHYATMTRHLERARFERWLPTGSLSAYCLEFTRPEGRVYALWNLRGVRPVTLHLASDAEVQVTDSMDNTTLLPSQEKAVTFPLSTSPVYVRGVDRIEKVEVGPPDHSNSVEWARTRNRATWGSGPLQRGPEVNYERVIASLGDGTWENTTERDEVYEGNSYAIQRYHGRMSTRVVSDPHPRPFPRPAGEGRRKFGPVLAIKLEKQDVEHPLMPWYTVIRPRKPVTIPGRALALGLWVQAHSDWGRVIYSLRDAQGERWISIGSKDEWNCDDVHSWSAFNFDGWRYLRFELPGHLPYDNFRLYGTTWWRFVGGDGVVDYPLEVEKIIIERRTHILYVNDIQPTGAEEKDVLLGDLIAEYGSQAEASNREVRRSRIRMEVPHAGANLPNPIAEMAEGNELPPTRLINVTNPDWGYDGTRCHVHFDEVEGAQQYQVWVAVYPDGRGAQPMAQPSESGQLLQGLRPATKFYLWVTYTDPEGRQSRPSNRIEIELVDAFGMK